MQNLDVSRNSFGRVPPSPTVAANRNSTASALDPNAISSMFPDAAAALESHRQKLQASGNGTKSNRNSALFENRTNLTIQTPTITTTSSNAKDTTLPPPSPWRQSHEDVQNAAAARTKAANEAVGQMGNWQAPPPSAGGLRSPRPPQITGNTNLQQTTITAPASSGLDLPPLSPYDGAGGNWASMVNTPVVPVFNTGPGHANADMVANATAMKLAALSTVNNRIILDSDMPKYKRRNRLDGQPGMPSRPPGMGGIGGGNMANIVMYNEHGQPIPIPPSVQAQQGLVGLQQRRSRPSSPGLAAFQSPTAFGLAGFASPQNNGFLAAYDTTSPLLGNTAFGLTQFGSLAPPTEGYLSDDVNGRGRSPRGRRGSSKPPEDPTDINLLNDIPLWLRSLRLHKYTDNLKDLKWVELVELDDEALEKRGVNALGARRKMLKVKHTQYF